MFKQLPVGVLLTAFILLQHICVAATDPRFMGVNKDQLRQLIAKTPISSSQHAIITARAESSQLQREAYEGYTSVWRKRQRDPNANLRRGVAALNYWLKVSSLPQKQAGVTVQQELLLYTNAKEGLATAFKLNPRSVDALVAYGYFSWQFDNRMDEGLSLVKRAVQLNPKSARVRANLGSIYSNPSGNAYNPQLAKRELELAIQLDPAWAFPRWHLMLLQINTRQFRAAQSSLLSYRNIVPVSRRNNVSVREMQAAINNGLKNQITQ